MKNYTDLLGLFFKARGVPTINWWDTGLEKVVCIDLNTLLRLLDDGEQ